MSTSFFVLVVVGILAGFAILGGSILLAMPGVPWSLRAVTETRVLWFQGRDRSE